MIPAFRTCRNEKSFRSDFCVSADGRCVFGYFQLQNKHFQKLSFDVHTILLVILQSCFFSFMIINQSEIWTISEERYPNGYAADELFVTREKISCNFANECNYCRPFRLILTLCKHSIGKTVRRFFEEISLTIQLCIRSLSIMKTFRLDQIFLHIVSIG